MFAQESRDFIYVKTMCKTRILHELIEETKLLKFK